MGYLRRHAIVVTGDDYKESKDILAAHAKATEIFPWVSAICPPQVNGERSFFIPPDGSKEGRSDSDKGAACEMERGAYCRKTDEGWLFGSDVIRNLKVGGET